MRSLTLIIVLAAITPPSHAGKLFACRDAAGHLSFIDHGCADARERREIAIATAPATVKAVSDADAKQIAAWAKASRSRLPASLGGTSRSGGTIAVRQRGKASDRADACATARGAQAEAERERSFHMGFDERRRLSDDVLSACGLR